MTRSFVVATFAGALMCVMWSGLVEAQSADDGGSAAGYYAEEEQACRGSEAGGAILSTGGSHTDDVKVACWAEYNDCKDDYVLNVGDFWGGRVNGTRYLYPDSYYEDGECGWATSAGSAPAGSYLYLYVGNALVLIGGEDQPTTSVKIKFSVVEYDSTNCTGSTTGRSWMDDWQCCNAESTSGDGFREMADFGIGDCVRDRDGTGGGTSACHQPDVEFRGPTSAATRSYKFKIESRVYDNAACTSGESALYYQEGCFSFNWT